MVLWMLIRTRKIVTRRVIRPGMISGLTRKLKYKEGHPKVNKGHPARYDFRVDTETERT